MAPSRTQQTRKLAPKVPAGTRIQKRPRKSPREAVVTVVEATWSDPFVPHAEKVLGPFGSLQGISGSDLSTNDRDRLVATTADKDILPVLEGLYDSTHPRAQPAISPRASKDTWLRNSWTLDFIVAEKNCYSPCERQRLEYMALHQAERKIKNRLSAWKSRTNKTSVLDNSRLVAERAQEIIQQLETLIRGGMDQSQITRMEDILAGWNYPISEVSTPPQVWMAVSAFGPGPPSSAGIARKEAFNSSQNPLTPSKPGEVRQPVGEGEQHGHPDSDLLPAFMSYGYHGPDHSSAETAFFFEDEMTSPF